MTEIIDEFVPHVHCTFVRLKKLGFYLYCVFLKRLSVQWTLRLFSEGDIQIFQLKLSVKILDFIVHCAVNANRKQGYIFKQ